MTTLDGIIVDWESWIGSRGLGVVDWGLFAADADEREAALESLENRRALSVLGDKGFLEAQKRLKANTEAQRRWSRLPQKA